MYCTSSGEALVEEPKFGTRYLTVIKDKSSTLRRFYFYVIDPQEQESYIQDPIGYDYVNKKSLLETAKALDVLPSPSAIESISRHNEKH